MKFGYDYSYEHEENINRLNAEIKDLELDSELRDKEIANFKTTMSTQAVNTISKTTSAYDKLQEGILTQSALLDKELGFMIKDPKTGNPVFSKINVFERNPIADQEGVFGGMVKEGVTKFLSPADQRWKLNPKISKLLQEGNLMDLDGNIIKDIPATTAGGTAVTAEDQFNEILKSYGLDEDVTLSSLKVKEEQKFSNTGVGAKMEEMKTKEFWTEFKDPFKKGQRPEFNVFKEGTKFGEKVKAAGNIAAVGLGAYQIGKGIEQGRPEEVVHGAIHAVTPWLLASGNPLAIGAVAVNTIWDLMDG